MTFLATSPAEPRCRAIWLFVWLAKVARIQRGRFLVIAVTLSPMSSILGLALLLLGHFGLSDF